MTSTSGPLKVVTFDLDDTLWAIGPVIIGAERALWAWLDEHCPRMTGRYDREKLMPIRAEILSTDPSIEHDISALRARTLAIALERSGFSADDARGNAEAAFEVFMRERHAVEYFEHVTAVLEALHHEFRLGVISNGNADILRLEIGSWFDFAISAAGVGIAKPAPDMFESALSAAQCEPREMVHVGDHHEHDIAGAQQLGIHTVWFNQNGRRFPGPRPASAEISAMNQLPDALTAIAASSAPIPR